MENLRYWSHYVQSDVGEASKAITNAAIGDHVWNGWEELASYTEALLHPASAQRYQQGIRDFVEGTHRRVEVIHEAENPHDANALHVWGIFRDTSGSESRADLGYVRATEAANLHRLATRKTLELHVDWVVLWPGTRGRSASYRLVALQRKRPKGVEPTSCFPVGDYVPASPEPATVALGSRVPEPRKGFLSRLFG